MTHWGFRKGVKEMKPNDRQKLCPNCDGNVPLEATECPYCAADLSAQAEKDSAPSQAILFKNQSLQESLASLYTPPYSSSTGSSPKAAPAAPKEVPPRRTETYKTATPPPAPKPAAMEMAAPEEEVEKGNVLSMILLSISGLMLTLGLLQLFFSDHGILRLEWDASYWFIYCLGALPLFYFGYKKLK